MARDGSGTYNLPAGQPVVTSTTISSTVHNTLASDVATALTASLAKDGQTTPSANLPMGTFRHTGVGDGSARTMYPSIGQIQDNGVCKIGSIAGTANAITGSLNPAITTFTSGTLFLFLPAANNTTATTITLNGLTTKTIKRGGTTDLLADDLVLGYPALISYDGTNFQLLNALTSPNGSVTNALLADMAAATVKGRASGAGTGVPVDLTAAQLVTIINTADGVGSLLDADFLDAQSGSFYTNAANLTGVIAAISGANVTSLNATQLTSGTVPDARFPATLPAASGLNLTALNATQLTSGTVPSARVTSVDAAATINSFTIGYRQVPRSTTATTLAVGDVGKCVAISATIAVPNSTFAAGDCVSIYNNSAGALTITHSAGTGRIAGVEADDVSISLAARGVATIWFNSATEWVISGNVS